MRTCVNGRDAVRNTPSEAAIRGEFGIMTVIQALLLGIIQGITSAIPVSSSGHVVLAGSWMGLNADLSMKLLVYLHLGTLAAVIWSFRRELKKIIRALIGMIRDILTDVRIFFRNAVSKEKQRYIPVIQGNVRHAALFLTVSTCVTALIGLLFRGAAESTASNLLITAMGFFVTALLLFVSAYTPGKKRDLTSISTGQAIIVGAFQGLSVIPGISRLAMVLTSEDLLGFSRKTAVGCAYMLAVPSVIGAFLMEMREPGVVSIREIGVLPVIIGILVSAFVCLITIRIMRRRLRSASRKGFAVYCVAAGILSVFTYM